MSKRITPLIIGNWKMNGTLLESMQNIKKLRSKIHNSLIGCQIIICPPFTLLRDFAEKVPNTGIKLGGQNCHHASEGSFTGEISANMLKNMTCEYVILGHSERRANCNENSELIAKKAKNAYNSGLTAIICVGETLQEKENDLTNVVVREQIINSLPDVAKSSNTVIAYEPVWAIGSGKIPTFEEIEETHKLIQDVIKSERPDFGEEITVIYGGSVDENNSSNILAIPGVDGLLVGRASLDVDKFWQIIESCDKN